MSSALKMMVLGLLAIGGFAWLLLQNDCRELAGEPDLERRIQRLNHCLNHPAVWDGTAAKVYNDRGVARWHQGDRVRALADLTRAIELDPENTEAYRNRGNIWRALGREERAVADFNRARQAERRGKSALFPEWLSVLWP